MVDLLRGYEAVKEGFAAVDPRRDVLRAWGPQAESFLQGQISQDIARLAAGESAWSLVLAPAGRVDAMVRVTRIAPDEFVIDTDGGWGQAVLVRLSRFKLRTKIDFEALDWMAVGLRGPAVVAPAPSAGAPVVADASWPGLVGVDLLGPAPEVPEGAVEVERAAYEAARIEAGVPVMGAELTERTIPAEAGLVGRTVSFTKGCYTGQELVARIDSRGSHVARHLRGLRLDAAVDVGAPVVVGGKEVGRVTSVAQSPALGWVALGYVGRAVEPGATVSAGDGVTATVHTLPLSEPGQSR
ncbi:MAG TPA: glycine cleavage T C-terminal barrel domain-containing protein [Acidimicrobiales bacterium]|nr:glycine cleavage T C-terminal barrel domain-containing protein [Acidimicrobiales bacterium]